MEGSVCSSPLTNLANHAGHNSTDKCNFSFALHNTSEIYLENLISIMRSIFYILNANKLMNQTVLSSAFNFEKKETTRRKPSAGAEQSDDKILVVLNFSSRRQELSLQVK